MAGLYIPTQQNKKTVCEQRLREGVQRQLRGTRRKNKVRASFKVPLFYPNCTLEPVVTGKL